MTRHVYINIYTKVTINNDWFPLSYRCNAPLPKGYRTHSRFISTLCCVSGVSSVDRALTYNTGGPGIESHQGHCIFQR
jgi:hypothetical protein